VTVREAAERLEVSVSLTYRLIAAGKLRCSRHGLGRGAIRISEAELAEYLASAEKGLQQGPEVAPRRMRLKHIRL
jgi:excisionase family DNA binding protein